MTDTYGLTYRQQAATAEAMELLAQHIFDDAFGVDYPVVTSIVLCEIARNLDDKANAIFSRLASL